jgi:hypothetical protein
LVVCPEVVAEDTVRIKVIIKIETTNSEIKIKVMQQTLDLTML